MRVCLYKALSVSLFLILINPSVSLATSATDPGVLMYKAGHLEQAKQYFEAEIAASPKNADAHYKNADAHYMLANVFLQMGRSEDAKKEYHLSEMLDRFGSTGQYSRLALTRLGGSSTATNSLFQPAGQQIIKNSVRKVSAEVNEKEQKEKAECDARIKQIYEESDAQVEKIEEEMQQRIEVNGYSVHGNHSAYNPEPLNEMIREECLERIDRTKTQARYWADKVMTAYQEKAMALEDSALAIDKSYDKQVGNIVLIPAGSNMYIRNYQIKSDSSGYLVPILAAPPKSLSKDLSDDKPHQPSCYFISYR